MITEKEIALGWFGSLLVHSSHASQILLPVFPFSIVTYTERKIKKGGRKQKPAYFGSFRLSGLENDH